jgi:signal transduction histidine kinase
VDDEVRIVELLRRELGRSYRVFTATSGREALEILEREFFVVVLADQRMPEMSGTKLMEHIVQRYPHTIRILLTGYTDTNALVDAINKGQVYRYVSKPWEPEELKIILRQGIERYELMEQNRLLFEDLKVKNTELCEALQELRKAQDEVLRSERLSMVGRMANMIVHDIKNPLTAVLGLTDMLLEARLGTEDKKHQYYRMIRSEGERILGMVREILEYVRGEGPALNLESCPLPELIEEVGREIEHGLNGTGIRLRIESRCSGNVPLDREKFKRVLHNLATNAKEAMEEGGELLLSTCQENECVWIRVSDTGRGIQKTLETHLFEPFVTEGKEHGSGLGLTIVKRLVEAHHGQISLESSSPQGTTFCIRLELAEHQGTEN